MFIRPCYRKKNGKRHAYWALVESVRTAKGPRQRVVGYLGGLPEKVRRGVKRVAQGIATDAADAMDASVGGLFPEADNSPQWVEIDAKKVRAENPRGFGGPWLGMQLVKMLRLDRFLADTSVRGKESVPWELTSLILILCRLLNPSSELYIAERFYRSTAFPEILGVPAEQVDDHRLYRGLDWLLDKNEALKDNDGPRWTVEKAIKEKRRDSECARKYWAACGFLVLLKIRRSCDKSCPQTACRRACTARS
ncbi:MAG: hypothetical protein FWD61_15745 [Phycisphaerales bacterium]|nr:hypothetical protein [Phycisphaerales bacterium]